MVSLLPLLDSLCGETTPTENRSRSAPLILIVRSGTRGTDGFAFHRVERLASDRFRAVPAHETIRMPLAVQRRDVVLHDGPVAPVALGGEHVEVVVAAVRFPVALVEPILAELLAALGAEEVLRVPGLLQGRYAFIQNWSIAVGTTWTEQIVIVRLAVRVAIALEEVPGAQLLVAVVAREVLRMPSLAQRRYDLPYDGLIACIAAPLLGGIHSLATHVGLQISEHGIQLVTGRGQLFGRGHRRQSALIVRGSLVWLRVIRHRLELVRSGRYTRQKLDQSFS